MKLPHRRLMSVRVRNSSNGLGVFARKAIAKGGVIGRVSGEIVDNDERDSNYLMELDDGLLLIPASPFRYLNHSCQPNSELFMWEDDDFDADTGTRHLYVVTLGAIRIGDELTIDYCWPVDIAIACYCRSDRCRGWIVDPDQLHLVSSEPVRQ